MPCVLVSMCEYVWPESSGISPEEVPLRLVVSLEFAGMITG